MKLHEFLNKNTQFKHIVFDFDSTLFQLKLDWKKFKKDFYQLLISIDADLANQLTSESIFTMHNEFVTKHEEKAKGLINELQVEFENTSSNTLVNEELYEFVKNNTEYLLYVWTSNTKPTINSNLERFKVKDKFKQIVTTNDVDLMKPAPDGFYKMYDEKTSDRGEWLFVGDSDADEKAAAAAQIEFYKIEHFEFIY